MGSTLQRILIRGKTTQSSERPSPMPTQDPVMNCHTRQFPRLENSSSALLATTPIPNEYQKTETMRLQHPDHSKSKVIKILAIHHDVGKEKNGMPFSTVEVMLLLDGNQTKHTTMRYSQVIDMLGGRTELKKFGSTHGDSVL